jgi:DNA-binding LacI/PurR family transcriptional regulator
LNNKSCKVKTCEKIEKVITKPNYIPNPHASAITVPIGKRSCSSVLWLQT